MWVFAEKKQVPINRKKYYCIQNSFPYTPNALNSYPHQFWLPVHQ
jgi:hypothetical protein